METGTEVKIRLFSYKSQRHYGGRDIKSYPHVCKAKFIEEQRDHTFVVELLEPCMLFSIGYKIAVQPNNFNI